MKKKVLSGLLALALVFGSAAALPEGVFEISSNITASAVSTATSGKCGKNVSWSLKNGVLTISGKGEMYNYASRFFDGLSPFSERTDIKSIVVESGVTSIGDNAFEECRSVTGVTIPKGVTRIGSGALHTAQVLQA